MLTAHPEVTALFPFEGTAVAAIATVEERQPSAGIKVVAADLTPDHRASIEDGSLLEVGEQGWCEAGTTSAVAVKAPIGTLRRDQRGHRVVGPRGSSRAARRAVPVRPERGPGPGAAVQRQRVRRVVRRPRRESRRQAGESRRPAARRERPPVRVPGATGLSTPAESAPHGPPLVDPHLLEALVVQVPLRRPEPRHRVVHDPHPSPLRSDLARRCRTDRSEDAASRFGPPAALPRSCARCDGAHQALACRRPSPGRARRPTPG